MSRLQRRLYPPIGFRFENFEWINADSEEDVLKFCLALFPEIPQVVLTEDHQSRLDALKVLGFEIDELIVDGVKRDLEGPKANG